MGYFASCALLQGQRNAPFDTAAATCGQALGRTISLSQAWSKAMQNTHPNKIPPNQVTALFADSALSFSMPNSATFADLADRLGRFGEVHIGLPKAVYLKFSAPGNNRRPPSRGVDLPRCVSQGAGFARMPVVERDAAANHVAMIECQPRRQPSPADPCAMVIFGATGNLARAEGTAKNLRDDFAAGGVRLGITRNRETTPGTETL